MTYPRGGVCICSSCNNIGGIGIMNSIGISIRMSSSSSSSNNIGGIGIMNSIIGISIRMSSSSSSGGCNR